MPTPVIIAERPPASSRACSQRLLLLPVGFIAAVAIAVLPFATMSPDADVVVSEHV